MGEHQGQPGGKGSERKARAGALTVVSSTVVSSEKKGLSRVSRKRRGSKEPLDE